MMEDINECDMEQIFNSGRGGYGAEMRALLAGVFSRMGGGKLDLSPVLAFAFILLLGGWQDAALAVVNVTAATGGNAISNSNIASGTWTALTGPIIAESAPSGIGAGTVVLNVPTGFIFNTASPVTVTVTGTGSPGADVTIASSTATINAAGTTITITITKGSTGQRTSTLTWSGIKVRPTACSPLVSGNITNSGTAGFTPSSTNYGTLTETGSTALTFIQQPTNTLINTAIAPAVTLNACGSGAALPTVTVALTTPAGATLSGTLSVATTNVTGLATFSNLKVNLAGTYTLTATSPGLTSAVSSSFIIYNPVPTTTSISPTSANLGATSFTMTVNGTNFVTTSVARFNGANRTTTYVSATQLTVTILTSDLTTAGTFPIDVVNPAISGVGGGTSNPQTFTVLNILPGRFNTFEASTAAGAIVGNIFTKIAGPAFTLDVVALNLTKTAVLTTFTGAVKVELLNASDNSGALDANNCRNTWTTIQTLAPNPAFVAADNGRKPVSFIENNAWKEVRIRVSYPATGAATAIGCSTDNFAIRPNSLNLSIKDTDWQTAGTARALNNSGAIGGNVHKAGQPFTLQATAINASAVTTTNYTGTPSAVLAACVGTACTATFGTFSIGAGTAVAGVINSTTATYSEVGAFALQLQDQTFANVDAADGTTANCAGRYVCSAALNVGRFVPDHFEVAVLITPVFRTFNAADASCSVGAAPRRTFTYIGQPFGYKTPPQATIYARNASGATTTNYSGTLWKIAGTSSSSKDCLTNPNICQFTSSWTTAGAGGNISSVVESYAYTLTPASTPNWDNASAATAAATVTPGAGASIGTGTIVISASNTLAFLRSTTTPQAAFTANITDTISVTDASEVGSPVIAGNGTITTTTPLVFNGTVPGSGIDFDGGGVSSGNEFRYGRLKLGNAHGSELLNLPIPIQTQYWNGTSFVTNTVDNCTTLVANNIKLTTLPAGVSASLGVFASGIGSLTLSPPTTAAKVAVDLCVDLGTDPAGGTVCAAATSANLPHLQGLWAPGTSYNNDPGARATFGVYKGANEFIYLRENY